MVREFDPEQDFVDKIKQMSLNFDSFLLEIGIESFILLSYSKMYISWGLVKEIKSEMGAKWMGCQVLDDPWQWSNWVWS